MARILPFSRAAASIDFLALVLLLILVLLAVSWWSVARKKALRLHKALQIVQAVILGGALLAFEWEIRRHDWRAAAEASPYFDAWVQPVLVLHLACAFPCFVLWVVTMTGAIRRFPSPIRSAPYAVQHRTLGRLTAIFTIATTLTGWLFFWLAFVS